MNTKGERRRIMGLRILKPGFLTTIQDNGRFGYQKDGVIVGGAADSLAFKVANLLVNNVENESAIEICMFGSKIIFEEDCLLAITGSPVQAKINNEPVKMWRYVGVRKGAVLEVGNLRAGCFTYLAVAGGFDVPKVMGSYSTYIRAGIGGFEGRALKEGDLLKIKNMAHRSGSIFFKLKNINPEKKFMSSLWNVGPYFYGRYSQNQSLTLRALKGPEYDLFDEDAQNKIWNLAFEVGADSDRMGYRLKGESLLLREKKELLSGAVTYGTMQVTPEGKPIVLMADRQTTGGYPRIIQIISVDLPKLAQAIPGTRLYFTEVNLHEAHQLYLENERTYRQIKKAIQVKLRLT